MMRACEHHVGSENRLVAQVVGGSAISIGRDWHFWAWNCVWLSNSYGFVKLKTRTKPAVVGRWKSFFAQVFGASTIFVDHAFDRHRCRHDRHVPASWFLQNHLLACTKTHFRGQKCMSMQDAHRWRQHRNRKKSSRIYMINWKSLIIGVRMYADMIVINR